MTFLFSPVTFLIYLMDTWVEDRVKKIIKKIIKKILDILRGISIKADSMRPVVHMHVNLLFF